MLSLYSGQEHLISQSATPGKTHAADGSLYNTKELIVRRRYEIVPPCAGADGRDQTMPRFFLHIRDGAQLIVDHDGSLLPDLATAHREATQGARDILAEHLRAGKPLNGQQIEITDEGGTLLAVVTFKSVMNLP
jgi:uncharacterized protein DUF6894